MGYIFVIAAVTGSVTVVSPASPPKILPPCAFTFASVFPEKYLISRSNDLYEYLLSGVNTNFTVSPTIYSLFSLPVFDQETVPIFSSFT